VTVVYECSKELSSFGKAERRKAATGALLSPSSFFAVEGGGKKHDRHLGKVDEEGRLARASLSSSPPFSFRPPRASESKGEEKIPNGGGGEVWGAVSPPLFFSPETTLQRKRGGKIGLQERPLPPPPSPLPPC